MRTLKITKELPTIAPKPQAIVTLPDGGGAAAVTWQARDFMLEHRSGVFDPVDDEMYRPEDGAAYYRALERLVGRSSALHSTEL